LSEIVVRTEIMVDEVARTEEFDEIPASCKASKFHCRKEKKEPTRCSEVEVH
jgi:hypothetical protein